MLPINEVKKFEYKGELFDTYAEAERAKYVDEIETYLGRECNLESWQLEGVLEALLKQYDITLKTK